MYSLPQKLAAEIVGTAFLLALMQVCGGSQSFNTVNQLRILGRWMRMIIIPNQSSVPKAFLEFEDDGRMKASAFYNRMVDVMEERMKFTLLTWGRSNHLLVGIAGHTEACCISSEQPVC